MATDFQKLKVAAAMLEGVDEDYSLQTLVQKSNLSRDVVTYLLKQKWIKQDQLKIVNLELTTAEEAMLYGK